MTAGPLENKRGEPSLVEKKIHEELKQLRVREPRTVVGDSAVR